MPLKILSDGNPDGTLIGSSNTDKIGFMGQVPVYQRSNPLQATIGAFGIGSIITYSSNQANFANIAATTTANQANLVLEGFNTLGSVGVNCAILNGDFIVGISKATTGGNTSTNYVGISGWRSSAANTVDVQFCNPGAIANIIANEVQWSVAVLRGCNPHYANLTPTQANVNAQTTVEMTYTIGGSGAAGTPVVNANGAITGITVSNGGSGYYTPPTVVITAPANANYSGVTANQPTLLTGTALPFPIPAYGVGATAVATIANGAVTAFTITDPGQGYVNASPPTVTLIPSTLCAPGMFLALQQNTYTANIGIGNVRIAGKNQIAIQYFNTNATNTALPTTQTFGMIALTSMPAISPFMIYKANLSAANTSAANAAVGSTNYTVPGLMATDVICSEWSNAAYAGVNGTTYYLQGGLCQANNLQETYVGPVVVGNRAAGTYSFLMYRQQMQAPIQVFQALVTPTAVQYAGTTEQTFLMPANIALGSSNNGTNFNVIQCNKPSHTPYISVVGCRQQSNTNVAITFMNVNTTTNIVPPAEIYTFAYFPTFAPTITGASGTGNTVAGQMIYPTSTSFLQTFALANELQQLSTLYGLIRGG
jgi:hypothetical protein